MALLHRTTRQDISAASFWVLPPERFWLTGVAIGGRRIVMRVTTTRIQPRTVALTTVTVIITVRLTTITTPELTAGMVALTVLTDPRIGAPVTTPTQAPTLEAVQYPRLTAAEVQHKHIIHTPARMRRRDKVQVPQPNGAARMCREETRALPLAITPLPMAP